ncbi:MAG TPA: hypothetical protein VH083_02535 [Myxococcales bacterium]|nr:hypothetical protein [Myxococcales bacterium]
MKTEKIGLATTALNISQRLGGPVATTSLAILTSLVTGAQGLTNSSAFFIPFLALNLLQFSVLILASRLPVRIPVQAAASA